jgi:hypothetical protein
MATQPQAPQTPDVTRATAPATPTFRYIDRPDLMETFSDSIEGPMFDGQTLRIEFCVNRLDPLEPNAPPTGRRYPACRLVLTPGAAVELMNRMQQVSAAMVKAGVLKTSSGQASTRNPPVTN